MAAVGRPATPVAQPSSPTVPSTPQPGTWQHPKFDEIARRQNALIFSDRNVRQLLYNCSGLLALWILERFAKSNLPSVVHAFDQLHPLSTYSYALVRVVLLYNIFAALRPLFRVKDDLSDIPLTPAQRRLLGLPPSDKPPTPGSQYVTPPRYPRSSTPHSGSPSSSYSASPLSAKGNSASGSPRGSQFSPSASPLLSKAIGGGLLGPKRISLSSPSPLGARSPNGNWLGTTTPSPTSSKGPSVTLNNKWLWDKGRRASGDSRVFS